MVDGKWAVVDGRLAFFAASGEQVHLGSADVFRVLFRGLAEISGQPVSDPRADLKELRFTNLPPEVAVRLWVKDGSATCSAGVSSGGVFAELNSVVDQVIISDVWYPVHSEDLLEALTWVSRTSADGGRTLTAGEVVQIRFASDLPFRLIDDFSITVESVTRHAGQVLQNMQLRATLYPYQEFGYAYLSCIAAQGLGCILGDEMGLGKTLQVIALLEEQRVMGAGSSLVLAPATVLENWRRELSKFAPEIAVIVHAGPDRSGNRSYLETSDVVVTSYETAARDEALLAQVNWNVLVLDEAQAIKSPDALRTQMAKRLPRRVSIAVTGTPVENRLEDLWSLCDFSMHGLLGPLHDFRARFTNTEGDAESLAPLVAPVLLRRRVADVAADLPELIEVPQFLEADPIFSVEYEEVRRRVKLLAPSARFGALQQLRMLAAGVQPLGAHGDVIQEKNTRLLELLEEMASSHQKALIFCSYTQALDRLVELVGMCPFIKFTSWIDGRTQGKQQIVDQFSDAVGAGVLVLNPRAGGLGLNIQAANHVIHFNPEWNPAVTDQASRRAYRRGQTLPVTVHHLLYAGTIEEMMWTRAHHKRDVAEAALTDTDPELEPSDIAWALEFSPVVR